MTGIVQISTEDSVTGDPRSVKSINGAVPVRQTASDVPFPSQNFLPFSGVAADVNTGTAVYISPDVSGYNRHEFSIYTAPGASSVQVLITHDGTNYEVTPIQVIDRSLVSGAAVQSLAQLTAIGNYFFDAKVKGWKLVNTGATTGAACAIRGSHSVK